MLGYAIAVVPSAGLMFLQPYFTDVSAFNPVGVMKQLQRCLLEVSLSGSFKAVGPPQHIYRLCVCGCVCGGITINNKMRSHFLMKRIKDLSRFVVFFPSRAGLKNDGQHHHLQSHDLDLNPQTLCL